MELAVVGSLAPPLATPPPYIVVGGFRIVELAALALCGEGKVIIYVEETVDLPLILEGCQFEIRRGIPPDVPKIEVGCVPHLLRSRNLRCGRHGVDLGGRELAAEPFTSLADLIQENAEIMREALSKLREVGVELLKGDARGVMKGEVYVRGKVYEYTYIEGPAVVGPGSAVLPSPMCVQAPCFTTTRRYATRQKTPFSTPIPGSNTEDTSATPTWPPL